MIFTHEAGKPADIEVWTDGSVGEIPPEFIHHLNDDERVSVKWDEGWYTATLRKFNQSLHGTRLAVKKLEVRHNKSPEVILIYNDGDEHAYDAHPTAS